MSSRKKVFPVAEKRKISLSARIHEQGHEPRKKNCTAAGVAIVLFWLFFSLSASEIQPITGRRAPIISKDYEKVIDIRSGPPTM